MHLNPSRAQGSTHLPNDPRLVSPLWQCLSADGIESHRAEAGEIVSRLLMITVEPNGFTELEHQDPHDWQFLTGLRSQAYPFRKALPAEHNLVTLLAWAEYLSLLPARLNRFFEAKAAGQLDSVESARGRTVRVSLCWPARVFSALLLLAALACAITVMATHPGWTLHPFGLWSVGLVIGTGLIPLALLYGHYWIDGKSEVSDPPVRLGDNWRIRKARGPWYRIGYGSESGHFLFIIFDGRYDDMSGLFESREGAAIYGLIAVAFAFAPAFFTSTSLLTYITLSLGGQLLFWEFDLLLFDGYRFYYLLRPNQYVDIYEDEKSRNWVTRPKAA